MTQKFLLSIDASDDELAEIVRLVTSAVSEHGGEIGDAFSAADSHGVVDVPHAIRFLIEAAESVTLGVLANGIYSRLSSHKKQSEVSLHEKKSKREFELFDASTGLRITVRESQSESVTRTRE